MNAWTVCVLFVLACWVGLLLHGWMDRRTP